MGLNCFLKPDWLLLSTKIPLCVQNMPYCTTHLNKCQGIIRFYFSFYASLHYWMKNGLGFADFWEQFDITYRINRTNGMLMEYRV